MMTLRIAERLCATILSTRRHFHASPPVKREESEQKLTNSRASPPVVSPSLPFPPCLADIADGAVVSRLTMDR